MGTELTKITTQVMTKERQWKQRMSLDACDAAAWTILDAYPNANIPNEEAYVRSMRELLLHFPASVAMAVASQKTGIVTLCKFPPSLAEIQEFADPLIRDLYGALKRDQEMLKQLAPPKRPELSEKDRKEIAAGLRALAKNLAGNLDMKRASRKRPRAHQCQSGDAIREQLGRERECLDET